MAVPVVWTITPQELQARVWKNPDLGKSPRVVERLKRYGLSLHPPPRTSTVAAMPSAPAVSASPGAFRFSGIASCPVPDRAGDIIELAGVSFDQEIPLLLQHDSHLPIGIARLTKTTTAIRFDAELPHVPDPGLLRERLSYVQSAIQARILRGVSIGFTSAPRSVERLPGGGDRFTAVEIHELSVVSLPMQQNALIDAPGVDHVARAVTPSPGLRLAIAASLDSPRLVRPNLTLKSCLRQDTR